MLLGFSLVVLLALAVKHVTMILLEGSIFGGLRSAIRIRMEGGSRSFRQLHELFSCRLCMSTQVSMWFVGVPTLLILHRRGLKILLHAGISPVEAWITLLLGGFLWAMAIASVAYFLLQYAEFHPRRFRRMQQDYEEQLQALRGMLQNGEAAQPVTVHAFTRQHFIDLAQAVQRACCYYGCDASRRRCRKRAVEEELTSWQREHNASDATYQVVLGALDVSLPHLYDGLRIGCSQNNDRYAECIRRSYEIFQAVAEGRSLAAV